MEPQLHLEATEHQAAVDLAAAALRPKATVLLPMEEATEVIVSEAAAHHPEAMELPLKATELHLMEAMEMAMVMETVMETAMEMVVDIAVVLEAEVLHLKATELLPEDVHLNRTAHHLEETETEMDLEALALHLLNTAPLMEAVVHLKVTEPLQTVLEAQALPLRNMELHLNRLKAMVHHLNRTVLHPLLDLLLNLLLSTVPQVMDLVVKHQYLHSAALLTVSVVALLLLLLKTTVLLQEVPVLLKAIVLQAQEDLVQAEITCLHLLATELL